MSRIVVVHGVFNELWGPHEVHQRWLPAVRDGLWHHGVTIDDAPCGEGRLAPLFGDRVQDLRVDNGHRAHDPEPYLNAAATGAAIAAGLGKRPS